MEDTETDAIKNAFAEFRTVVDNDSVSHDTILALLPGGDPNVPENPLLKGFHSFLKSVAPRLLPPRIGTIEVSQDDVLKRTRSQLSWVGRNEHKIIFASQTKQERKKNLPVPDDFPPPPLMPIE